MRAGFKGDYSAALAAEDGGGSFQFSDGEYEDPVRGRGERRDGRGSSIGKVLLRKMSQMEGERRASFRNRVQCRPKGPTDEPDHAEHPGRDDGAGRRGE